MLRHVNTIISIERKQNADKYKKNQNYRLLPYYKSVAIKRIWGILDFRSTEV